MADSEATATRRTANLVLVLLFFAGVITPCLGTILRLQTGGIAGENRPMARRPSFAVGPRQLPRQIDAWFNDHFGFRNLLVEARGLIAYGVFGVSGSPLGGGGSPAMVTLSDGKSCSSPSGST